MTALDIIVAVTALVGAILGGIATVSKAHTESKVTSRSLVEAHMARQDKRIQDLERRADRNEARERLRDNYIAQLRQHIHDGQPPPPPPWPDDLIAFDRDGDARS